MLSRSELYARHCVADLVYVVERVPAEARSSLLGGESSAALLLFQSILHGQSSFALTCLENQDVEKSKLTVELDAIFKAERASETAVDQRGIDYAELDRCTREWLDLASLEANAMRHDFLGTEHLLLALLAHPNEKLAALLAHHGIQYDRVKASIIEALPFEYAPKDSKTIVPTDLFYKRPKIRSKPRGTGSDTPAIGVPRRFGVGILMMIVTLYAFLFSLMRLLGASPAEFVAIAVFITGVGLGQAVLFNGQYPRAASMWVGAVLFPVEVVVGMIIRAAMIDRLEIDESVIWFLVINILVGLPIGMCLGYVAGCATAGAFFLVDRYEKKRVAARQAMEKETGFDDIGVEPPSPGKSA